MSVVSVSHKAIVIIINKSYYEGISKEALYEITRGVWRVNPAARVVAAEYAIAMCHGEVKEVYCINTWHPAGTLEYHHRPKEHTHIEGRWEFEGKVAEENVRNRYKGKQIDAVSHGSPILYINC